MNTEIDASLNEKVKATLLKGRSKQKETMNVYLIKVPSALNVKVKKFNQARVNGGSNYDSLKVAKCLVKSSTFFVVKSFSKKENRFSRVRRKKVRHLSPSRCTVHLRTHMKILTLLFYIFLLI